MKTQYGRKKKKVAYNPTVSAMRTGLMRFRRRIDVPMWHVQHLRQLIPLLRGAVDELERLERSNSLRNVDRCTYAQAVLMHVNAACAHFEPSDPRRRGGEDLAYDPYLIDRNGHKELQARVDLDEPHQRPDDTSGK